MPRIEMAPDQCLLTEEYRQGTYQDCFCEPLAPGTDAGPVALFLKITDPMPLWVRLLMAIRNRVVSVLGLKSTSEGMPEKKSPVDYVVGDFIDFFKITYLSENEVVVSTDDRHLDASFSLLILEEEEGRKAYFTSVVKTKERLGDVYMFVIAPFHRWIVGSLLKRVRRS